MEFGIKQKINQKLDAIVQHHLRLKNIIWNISMSKRNIRKMLKKKEEKFF